jgi:hypothetical protein
MTMLTQTRGPSKPAPYSSERQNAAGAEAAEAHPGMIKRFCMFALTILLAGAALAGIIARSLFFTLSISTYTERRIGLFGAHLGANRSD